MNVIKSLKDWLYSPEGNWLFSKTGNCPPLATLLVALIAIISLLSNRTSNISLHRSLEEMQKNMEKQAKLMEKQAKLIDELSLKIRESAYFETLALYHRIKKDVEVKFSDHSERSLFSDMINDSINVEIENKTGYTILVMKINIRFVENKDNKNIEICNVTFGITEKIETGERKEKIKLKNHILNDGRNTLKKCNINRQYETINSYYPELGYLTIISAYNPESKILKSDGSSS